MLQWKYVPDYQPVPPKGIQFAIEQATAEDVDPEMPIEMAPGVSLPVRDVLKLFTREKGWMEDLHTNVGYSPALRKLVLLDFDPDQAQLFSGFTPSPKEEKAVAMRWQDRTGPVTPEQSAAASSFMERVRLSPEPTGAGMSPS